MPKGTFFLYLGMLKYVQNICQVNHHGLQKAGVAKFITASLLQFVLCFEIAFEKEVIFQGYGTQTYSTLVVFI